MALQQHDDLVLLKLLATNNNHHAISTSSNTAADHDTIVAALKARHSSNQIFTRIGASAMVMVNPVQGRDSKSSLGLDLGLILGHSDNDGDGDGDQLQQQAGIMDMVLQNDPRSRRYAEWAKDYKSDKLALPPHIYDIAASAFNHMLRDQQDQSILLL
jgi:hypothetical protein